MGTGAMSARPDLKVIDGNGEISDDLVPILSDAAALMEVVVKQRCEIAGLKRAAAAMAAVDPDAETIGDVLSYWKDKTNHPRSQIPVDGKRWRIVKARMKDGFTADQLRRAIDGVAAFPWEGAYGERFADPGEGRKRKDDLSHAMGDEEKTERRIRLAEADAPARAYRRFLFDLTQQRPRMVTALAMLGAHESVHGEVLAAAVRWAHGQEARHHVP